MMKTCTLIIYDSLHSEATIFRKAVFLLILVLLLTTLTTSVTFAAEGSNCPPGFTLEMAMPHDDHDHHHRQVGTSADQNGDDHICMKPITPDETIHVHVDNNVPSPNRVRFTYNLEVTSLQKSCSCGNSSFAENVFSSKLHE